MLRFWKDIRQTKVFPRWIYNCKDCKLLFLPFFHFFLLICFLRVFRVLSLAFFQKALVSLAIIYLWSTALLKVSHASDVRPFRCDTLYYYDCYFPSWVLYIGTGECQILQWFLNVDISIVVTCCVKCARVPKRISLARTLLCPTQLWGKIYRRFCSRFFWI